jgi:hypothetical protein
MKPTNTASIDKRIETMVATETPAASVVQAAIAAEKKAKEDREVERVRAQLRTIDQNTERYVNQLRAARAVVKKAEANLRAVLKAADEFTKTGNCDDYDTAMRAVRNGF